MSKHWGYVCQSHNPQIESDRMINGGQETLADVYRRERAGERPNDPVWAEGWGIIPWLREHPHCVIALRSEYGETVPLDPPTGAASALVPQTLHPITALCNLMAFSSRDWAANREDAWMWGIVMGWEGDPDVPDDEGAWDVVAARHGWDESAVQKLRQLHERFKATLPPDA